MTEITSTKPTLYSAWNSSCSWRVRIVLKFKTLNYNLKTISFDKNEQHDEEFLKINPLGYIPALVIDNDVLIDSYNIMMYLEENRMGYKLIPVDPKAKIKVREICMIIVSSIQPLQNTGVLKKLGNDLDWARYWINKGFKAVEKILTKTTGKYCVGDAITMADCCLIPQVFNARRYNVDLSDYPNIVRIDAELADHPAFKTTHPSVQPDYPKDRVE